MLRLSFITRLFATTTPVYKGYTIRKLAYLIEAPPAPPANSWARYLSQQTKGKQGLKVATSTKALSQKWKNLPGQVHQKFKKQYEDEKKQYLKLKQQYEAKYTVPFKRVTNTTLFIQNFYKDNTNKLQSKDIRQYAKVWTSQFKKLTPEEKEKLKAEANRINSKRRKVQEKLKFPIRQYFTEAAYSRSHKVSKTLGVREKRRQQRQQYQEYVQNWEEQVAQWLKQNEYNISIQDFTKLYNKTYRKLQKEKEQKKQQVEDEDD